MVVQCRHFSDKGVLYMRTTVLFAPKNFGFFEIYDVSARTRGEGIQFFAIFADVFYGRPLTRNRTVKMSVSVRTHSFKRLLCHCLTVGGDQKNGGVILQFLDRDRVFDSGGDQKNGGVILPFLDRDRVLDSGGSQKNGGVILPFLDRDRDATPR